MKRIVRIYHPQQLMPATIISVTPTVSHYLQHVLRMRIGDELVLFDGRNLIFRSVIHAINAKKTLLHVLDSESENRESPLHLHLGQVISRGERMDITIQKAVELGVTIITPLFSTRCEVKLNSERLNKKMAHWQQIIISACQQCGRNLIPLLAPPLLLEKWCQQQAEPLKLMLNPHQGITIKNLPTGYQACRLLVGAEGGFDEKESAIAAAQHFINLRLGPRVLRTETAALVALSTLQAQFGDLK